MKILMLNLFYPPYQGGTEKHLREVCTRLVKKNFEVTVLSSALPYARTREEVVNGVRLVRSPGIVLNKTPVPIPPPVPLNPTHLFDLHREAKNADVVHIHNRFAYNLLDLFLVKKILHGKKLSLTLHNARPQGIDLVTDFFGGAYDDLFVSSLFKNCDRIGGVSQNTLDITLPKKLKYKTQVIYNGVDVKKYNPKNKPGSKKELFGDKMILTVCRLMEQKGLKYLLNAFKRVLADEPKAMLVIVGRGPLLDHLRNEAKQLGVESRVFFEPRQLAEEELLEYYSACKVFALPSLWEPFGMVFVEAMAHGKPVVGTKIGGIPEIVSSDSGFLVPPRDHVILAERILELLSDNSLNKKMGYAARRVVEKKFTWDNTADSYKRFYSYFE
ncbi:glycosyltransferase family 4 protein [Candidatus Micrarchaeota archaeon]|nr:glycosyltransferase family 4 protein [Candidatus Micrarchaeota archaeon]